MMPFKRNSKKKRRQGNTRKRTLSSDSSPVGSSPSSVSSTGPGSKDEIIESGHFTSIDINRENTGEESISDHKGEQDTKKKSIWSALGPGIVTGASDNDPSGIATYSQAGARFGYGQLWMALVSFPLVVAVQEMCARIGIVSGKGLSELIKENYSKKLLFAVTSLLLIANTINIGADIGAMGASLRLIVPQIPLLISTLLFTAIILLAEIFVPYKIYAKILKYLTLSLFFYVITALIAVHDASEWGKILNSTLIPHIQFDKDFILMLVAILGTTISPYLFFWQTSHEVEEEVKEGKIDEMGGKRRNNEKPKVTKKEIKFMRIDILAGMALAQSIFWFIIITSATTLHNNGTTNITSAEQAAKALEPLIKGFPHAGQVASAVFAAGIIGTGLLAVPILAASASYAVAEGFGWKEGLYKKFLEAPKFYGVIIVATVIGLWINFSGIDPIQALVYTAVINGIISVPLLVIIVKIANNKKILGEKVNKRASNILSMITIGIMGIASITMVILTWFAN